jgi:hypothetical protein
MNIEEHRAQYPIDVTFFIGPVGSPPEIKRIYQRAVERSRAGNNTLLDELLESRIAILREIAEGREKELSPLKGLIESLVDREIGELPLFVSKGFMNGVWTPILTIGLGGMRGNDGGSIGALFDKRHGEVVAALLGKMFRANWIQTSWAYPIFADETVHSTPYTSLSR